MHDQVGVAADRAGEVGVFRQVQPEVADVLGIVLRLHLAAQDHLVDDIGVRPLTGVVQQLVEAVGVGRLALAPGDVQRLQEVGQGLHLLGAGRVVDAVDQRRTLLLQRLGGRDVGLDHHLLDQPVRLQRGAFGDRGDLALGADDDAALVALDGQGRAGVAAFQHKPVGGPQRLEHAVDQRAGLVVRRAVDGRLGLFVAELGRRAHQAADEAVAGLPAVAVEDHPHGHGGPVLAFAQAAEAVAQPLGQHRLDAVGEVDAVALLAGLLVQGHAVADVGGDVGDGDPDDPAAGVLRVRIGMGEDGVVVIAGVGRVDGDERQVAQVLAPLQRRVLGGFRLGLGLGGEAHRDAVGVDGDERRRPRLILAADALQQLAALGAVALAARLQLDLGQDQIAVLQVARLVRVEDQAVLGLAINRLDPDLAMALADHAQDAVGALAQLLDQPRLGLAALQPLEADQAAVADARRAGDGLVAVGRQPDQRQILAALDQLHIEIAVIVALDHVGDAHGREGPGLGEAAPAALAQRALGLEALEHLAQRAAVGALQPEGLGDISLLRLARVAQEADQGLAVREPLGEAGHAGRARGAGLGHYPWDNAGGRQTHPPIASLLVGERVAGR